MPERSTPRLASTPDLIARNPAYWRVTKPMPPLRKPNSVARSPWDGLLKIPIFLANCPINRPVSNTRAGEVFLGALLCLGHIGLVKGT